MAPWVLFLAECEEACTRQAVGAFLRGQGLYSLRMNERRKLRDARVLAGKNPGESIGKLAAEQAQIARLRRRLEVSGSRLERFEAALGVMGKLHELLESLSENTNNDPNPGKRR